MRRCDACKIDYTGDLDKCPLCQAPLTGEAEPAVFPRNTVRKSGVLAARILGFATGASALIMLFLGLMIPLPGGIVFLVCAALALNFLYVRNILVHNPDFLRAIMRYFLVLLALVAVWFIVTQDLVITTFVVPCICIVAIVFDAVLVIIFRGSFVSNFAKYLLFDIVLGFAPLVLMACGLTYWNVLTYVSALIASILLLALIVFGHRTLKNEIRKLFNA